MSDIDQELIDEYRRARDSIEDELRKKNLSYDSLIQHAGYLICTLTMERDFAIDHADRAERLAQKLHDDQLSLIAKLKVAHNKARLASIKSSTRSHFTGKKMQKSESARHSALIRHSNSNNGKVKAIVFKAWQDWQQGLTIFRFGTDFDNAMVDEHKITDKHGVSAPETVKKWRTIWKKGKC